MVKKRICSRNVSTTISERLISIAWSNGKHDLTFVHGVNSRRTSQARRIAIISMIITIYVFGQVPIKPSIYVVQNVSGELQVMTILHSTDQYSRT